MLNIKLELKLYKMQELVLSKNLRKKIILQKTINNFFSNLLLLLLRCWKLKQKKLRDGQQMVFLIQYKQAWKSNKHIIEKFLY